MFVKAYVNAAFGLVPYPLFVPLVVLRSTIANLQWQVCCYLVALGKRMKSFLGFFLLTNLFILP